VTAKAFQPLTRDEMSGLNGQLSQYKASIDKYFHDHVDA